MAWFTKDLAEIQTIICSSRDPLLKELRANVDNNLEFSLVSSKKKHRCVLMMPESASGEFSIVYDESDFHEFGRGSLKDVFNRVVTAFASTVGVPPSPSFVAFPASPAAAAPAAPNTQQPSQPQPSPVPQASTPPAAKPAAPKPASKKEEELEELKTVISSMSDCIVSDLKLDSDGNLAFSLNAGKRKFPSTLLIPESADGEYSLMHADDFVELGKGSLRKVMQSVCSDFAKRHALTSGLPQFVEGAAAPPPAASATNSAAPAAPPASSQNVPQKRSLTRSLDKSQDHLTSSGESDVVVDDNYAELEEDARIQEAGRKTLNMLANSYAAIHGNGSAGMYNEITGDIRMRISLPLAFIERQNANAWGLHYGKPLIVEFEFIAPSYFDPGLPPRMSLYQSNSRDFNSKTLSDVTSFGLQWQLSKRITDWFKRRENWPPTTERAMTQFLPRLCDYIVENVMNCTKHCIICGGPVVYEMLKPSICASPLCSHSYEQYGLGQDVLATIKTSPSVVDFLISATYAAAQADIRRFVPFPTHVEAKDYTPQGAISKDFMKDNKAPDNSKVLKMLNHLPPISTLLQLSDTKMLKAMLDNNDSLVFPLLRWIITSNRAHLVKLDPKYHISEMATPHQYLLLSSPPEKEAKFRELKAIHGSFYAFHGSGFGNWHSILRIGLKNYSNTALMSAGAAYGPGIYMAPNSSISLGYAACAGGWPKSMFADEKTGQYSCQCLALCEVINYEKKYVAKPYYVVPEEAHVMTRYFFIYSTAVVNRSLNVEAAKLKVPDMSNIEWE